MRVKNTRLDAIEADRRETIRQCLLKTRREMLAEGTTGASFDCLHQCTRYPLGLISGTNAGFVLRELARDVCDSDYTLLAFTDWVELMR